VIFAMPKEHFCMMNKELIYTAFTRAAKKLHVVGSERMLDIARSNSCRRLRYTHVSKMVSHLSGETSDLRFKNTHLCNRYSS